MGKRSFLFYFALLIVSLATILFSTALVLAQGTPFTNRNISFHLPEGWTTKEIPSNFEKEVIAWLKSEKAEGVTMLVFCYTGWRQNYNSVRIAGLKTIGASYPKGQEMLKKPTKIKTDVGSTAVWEYWRGFVETGGQMVTLESPMGIVETKNGWVLMIGYSPATFGPQLEEDFFKIINSVK